jgi:hypothetical protein
MALAPQEAILRGIGGWRASSWRWLTEKLYQFLERQFCLSQYVVQQARAYLLVRRNRDGPPSGCVRRTWVPRLRLTT